MPDAETECISKNPEAKDLRLNYSAMYISLQHPSTIQDEFGKSLVLGIENGQNSYRRSEYARRARRAHV
jgi:hypothetical protein